MVGVSQQTIYATEHSRYNPSLELAFELARHFDCFIEELSTSEFDERAHGYCVVFDWLTGVESALSS